MNIDTRLISPVLIPIDYLLKHSRNYLVLDTDVTVEYNNKKIVLPKLDAPEGYKYCVKSQIGLINKDLIIEANDLHEALIDLEKRICSDKEDIENKRSQFISEIKKYKINLINTNDSYRITQSGRYLILNVGKLVICNTFEPGETLELIHFSKINNATTNIVIEAERVDDIKIANTPTFQIIYKGQVYDVPEFNFQKFGESIHMTYTTKNIWYGWIK